MSSYFDALVREVGLAADDAGENDEQFLAHVTEIEKRMFRDVTQISGDREFPDDLRERMMGVFAVKSVYHPGKLEAPERAIELVLRCRSSRCIEDMHDLHHELASRRIVTRFGILSDHPVNNLARRDEQDAY